MAKIGNISGKKGASLLVVLMVLAVLSQLVLAVLEYRGRTDNVARNEQNGVAAKLAVISGMNYLLHRVETMESSFRTDSLYHETMQSGISFKMQVKQEGLHARWRVEGVFKNQDRKAMESLSGMIAINEDSIPTIQLNDPLAKLVYAGTTRIIGDIALYGGGVDSSRESRIPVASGMIHQRGKVFDSTWSHWSPMELDRGPIEDWLDETLNGRNIDEFSSISFDDYDSLDGELRLAKRIHIGGAASINHSVLCARTIVVDTKGIVNAQLIALDSLIVENGRSVEQADMVVLSDSGYLELKKWRGKAVVLYAGKDRQRVSLKLGNDVDIDGAVISNGVVEPQGAKIKGSLIAWNVMANKAGTRWFGYLDGAQIERNADARTAIPDLLRGWPYFRLVSDKAL